MLPHLAAELVAEAEPRRAAATGLLAALLADRAAGLAGGAAGAPHLAALLKRARDRAPALRLQLLDAVPALLEAAVDAAARASVLDAAVGRLVDPDDRVRADGWPLPRLQWYAGLRPLRHWLADRLFGGIEARWESSQRERLDTLSNGRSLASPAVNAATAT